MMCRYQKVHLEKKVLLEFLSLSSIFTVDSPMKAMSYFCSLLAKQGKYGSRPKVEMPEKTESA